MGARIPSICRSNRRPHGEEEGESSDEDKGEKEGEIVARVRVWVFPEKCSVFNEI